MSLDAFLTKLSAGATRAEKIAILASETDALTGIINGTTKVAKSYFENVGPASNTGTIYAAVVDIMNILGGIDTSLNLDLNGVLSIGTDRVGINASPAADRFQVNYAALFDVSIYSEGDINANADVNLTGGGNLVMYPDGLGNGFLSIGANGLIRAKEGSIGAQLNNPFTLLEYTLGAVKMHHPRDEPDYDGIGGSPDPGCFLWMRDGTENLGAGSKTGNINMNVTL